MRKAFLPLLFAAAISLGLLAGCCSNKTSSANTKEVVPKVTSDLNIDLLKVGKADCNIITSGDMTLMIDTGEKQDGDKILEYLEEHNIDQIDYLIITHYDKDHVGSAAQIVSTLPIGQVIEPGYKTDSPYYADFVAACTKQNVSRTTLNQIITLDFNDALVTVYPPLRTNYKEGDNDFSIVTSIEHGTNSFLFTGDAQTERLQEIMNQLNVKSTFLKVPHHGRYDSLSSAFLKSVDPEYAVITCSNKNPADEAVIQILEDLGTQTYLTKDGNVHVTSDGTALTVTQS